ncbi:uncharacterized protein LOC127291460 [Leptopilina boulardi]|uniref:uncharacterized protein LOC127291460 n=1 Tax=Leptopilina boulardi TaxID=63433 RepID=UPI0021F556A8|nr:uncharacterized protein LOC127291460 [Leptopilina boulardi]
MMCTVCKSKTGLCLLILFIFFLKICHQSVNAKPQSTVLFNVEDPKEMEKKRIDDKINIHITDNSKNRSLKKRQTIQKKISINYKSRDYMIPCRFKICNMGR